MLGTAVRSAGDSRRGRGDHADSRCGAGQNATAVLSVLGIGATIFISFRNNNAYDRWWEARTLWGNVIINCRALHNALASVDNGSAAMASALDRMRRRQVRHAWRLAAELRGVDPPAGVADLTPEDPADATVWL